MSIASNHDLQATFQLLSLLERAKAHSEEVLDSLAGVYAVIDDSGAILKGNRRLGTLLEMDYEGLLGHAFSKAFRKESWNLFASKLLEAKEKSGTAIEFELAIDPNPNKEIPYFWHVSRYQIAARSLSLFTVIGSDISALRAAEKQIAQMFSSLPLGIMSVGAEGRVQPQFSAYTEWLFGGKHFVGQTLREAVFKWVWSRLKKEEQESVEALCASIGSVIPSLDSVMENLPKQAHYLLPPGKDRQDRYLGISYQPVSFSGKLESILLIVEDRTEAVLRKQKEEREAGLSERTSARILQIKQCAPDVLTLLFDEIGRLVAKLDSLFSAKNYRDFASALHGVKGNARVAGFEFLKDLAHQLETTLTEATQSPEAASGTGMNAVEAGLKSLHEEWDELGALYEALVLRKKGESGAKKESVVSKQLFERYTKLVAQQAAATGVTDRIATERVALALQAVNFEPASSLENLVKMRAAEFAKRQDRQAEIAFDWKGITLSPESKAVLSDSLLHLVNNAICHGIESKDIREKLGKKPVGQIWIRMSESGGWVNCFVEDDGSGVDSERVKKAAIRSKLISIDQGLSMSRHDLLQLIFRPGLSTSEMVTEAAGRGVGLDAVATALKELGGGIVVQDREGGGTRFSLKMRTSHLALIQRTVTAASDFSRTLLTSIQGMVQLDGFKIDLDQASFDSTFKTGLLYGDGRKLCIAISTCIGKIALSGPVKVVFSKGTGGMVQCAIINVGARTSKTDQVNKPEFEFPLALCKTYLEQHMGYSLEGEAKVELAFGHFLTREQIPPLYVGLDKDISLKQAERALQRVKDIADELDLSVEYTMSSEMVEKQGARAIIDRTSIKEGARPNVIITQTLLNATHEVMRAEILTVIESQMVL
jgi:signal transduction histidine kinase